MMRSMLSKQLRISLIALAALVFLYALLRLGFLVYNGPYFTGLPVPEVLLAFVYGLRFDLSGLLMLNLPILLLYNLPGHPSRKRWFGLILFGLFCTVNLFGIGFSLADYAYFPTIQRRLTYEPLIMSREILAMIPGLTVDYWHLSLLLVLADAGFIWLSFRFLAFWEKREPYRFHPLKEGISLLLLVGLVVLGIRGGLQSKPIRQSHAFFSSHRAVGYLALNTPFSILRSLKQESMAGLALMPREEARTIMQGMVYGPEERNLDPEYPFLRQAPSPGPVLKYNVVIFVLESWTAGDVGALGARPSPTPHFDLLASEGWLFTNFMANGQRSVEVAPAILASVPNLFQAPLIGSRSELDRFLGLGAILSRHGYTTSFHHGAKTGSMGFDAYSRLAGFRHYYGMEDYPGLTDAVRDGTWGVFDHAFFGDAIRRLDGFQQPFAAVIYSLSPHDPMRIPPELASHFAPYAGEGKYRQALRYSDYSLGLFFEQARSRSWFGRTIFIIMADHTYFAAQGDFRATFHIPLLIYAPGLVPPRRDDRLGAQIDVQPTVLELLHLPDPHASMGRSLVGRTRERWAVVKYGTQYGLVTETHLFLSDLENGDGLYAYRRDPKLTKNLKDTLPEEARQLRRKLMAYLQEATEAVQRDRICREKDLK